MCVCMCPRASEALVNPGDRISSALLGLTMRAGRQASVRTLLCAARASREGKNPIALHKCVCVCVFFQFLLMHSRVVYIKLNAPIRPVQNK